MASRDKTGTLSLCVWSEEDRPQRADFNEDREQVDDALGALSRRAEGLDVSAAAALALAGQAVREMRAHGGDGEAHTTPEERQGILDSRFVAGGYAGNGQMERQIALGFEPRFAVIWCCERPPVVVGSGGFPYLYRDLCVPGVESSGCETYAGGLYVFQMNNQYNGFEAKLNEAGRTYRYVVWK